MPDPSNNESTSLDAFEKWLSEKSTTPSPDFLARTRVRLHDFRNSSLVDLEIDEQLRLNPSLPHKDLRPMIRHRLSEQRRSRRFPLWQKWATPLAAAATLAFSFFVFQSSPPPAPPVNDRVEADIHSLDNSEFTRIFALASNLQPSTDLAAIELSPQAIALLSK